MASWIGATDAQRFWQYIVPAARRAVADGGWLETEMAALAAKGSDMKAKQETFEVGSTEYRVYARRIEQLREQYRGLIAMRRTDLATLAEADRRKAYHKAKAA